MTTAKRRYLDPAPDMRVWLEPDGTVGHYVSNYGEARDRDYAIQAMQRLALKLQTDLDHARAWLVAAQRGKWSVK